MRSCLLKKQGEVLVPFECPDLQSAWRQKVMRSNKSVKIIKVRRANQHGPCAFAEDIQDTEPFQKPAHEFVCLPQPFPSGENLISHH